MGYAAALWFERGEKLTRSSLEKVSRAVTGTVIDRLKSLGQRKPKRKTLRERVQQSIETLPDIGPKEEESLQG
jgi:hypothetical protein